MELDMHEILIKAVEMGASDIHISANESPSLRINGDIVKFKMEPLTRNQSKTLIYDIMNDAQRSIFERELEIDFSFDMPGVARFRANVFEQMNGPAGVFRQIPTHVLSLEEIKAPPIFKSIANLPRGLVLVTGPTGSGKSTTLAAMIDYINKNKPYHILTIEDPVEFVYESQKSIINQREVGSNTTSFGRALKSALREDPDIILIGEMRDLETISLAITAAETGHLVFGTLHTNSAPKTIDRIIDAFPAGEKEMIRAMLSETLQAVISQTLVKRADGKGRVAAHEIMLGTPAIRNLIREDKIAQMRSIIETSRNQGMQTLDHALKELVEKGIVTLDAAREKAFDKTKFIRKGE